ncbi:adenylate/guanylate cyclase domain-containing protein [Pseudoalteromonas phenolica]|uniref:Adenylate/guanylate cyclase domain-containing protein n=1 Tax=Pseudoalteromonas phenolica TaxID=161398 RepID=A0A5S3YQB2_9GAMM|nr:adenylate/guanylate cyclase domain-containing protein [Pseudoalteromonas phenolica]TMP78899.1 adenylate/guanylate cyclase domain-containing protein [Pseudoalteromonas phenolica]
MKLQRLWNKFKFQWFCGLFIVFFCILIHVSFLIPGTNQGEHLKRLEGLAYDLRLEATLSFHPAREFLPIIIVDIDEESIKKIGRFPWSRTTMAELHQKLIDLGVTVIAYDVLFSEHEVNPIDKIISKSQNGQLNQNLTLIRENFNADLEFSNTISDSDTVLGLLLEHKDSLQIGELPNSVFTSKIAFDKLPAPDFSGYVASLPLLQKNALGNGFINSAPDGDGFVRYAMLFAKHNGQLYPSLSLEVARLYTLSDSVSVISEEFGDNYSITGVKIGNEMIPTDDFGRVAIPYRGPAFSFPYVSASDVIFDQVDTELFDQSIVFIGTSAVGHADLRTTPVGVLYPGVEVHANLLEGLIFPQILPSRPDWIDGAVVVSIIIIGVLGAIILPFLELLGIVSYTFISFSGFIGLNAYLWSQYYLDFPQVAILLMLALQVVILGSLSFFNEHKQKLKIKNIFDQYVPPEHIQEIIENPQSMSVSGERRNMTVLFADIRDFTSISEQLDASELKEMLNLYLTPITKLIFEHHGTIDKYVGDMVMAFWNAPIKVENHEELAVSCALHMHKKVEELQSRFYDVGLPRFSIGIGINSGEMNVGDMGSVYRRAYTVLGDAVNLGSRLEGVTKFYGVKILVSENTFSKCKHIAFRPVDKVKVKGKKQAVIIYEPIDLVSSLTSEQKEKIFLHEKAWNSYLRQSWGESLQEFTTLKNRYPCEKLFAIFCQRISKLEQMNLSKEWDGSYEHVTK